MFGVSRDASYVGVAEVDCLSLSRIPRAARDWGPHDADQNGRLDTSTVAAASAPTAFDLRRAPSDQARITC